MGDRELSASRNLGLRCAHGRASGSARRRATVRRSEGRPFRDDRGDRVTPENAVAKLSGGNLLDRAPHDAGANLLPYHSISRFAKQRALLYGWFNFCQSGLNFIAISPEAGLSLRIAPELDVMAISGNLSGEHHVDDIHGIGVWRPLAAGIRVVPATVAFDAEEPKAPPNANDCVSRFVDCDAKIASVHLPLGVPSRTPRTYTIGRNQPM
jgi:hypothetical protein